MSPKRRGPTVPGGLVGMILLLLAIEALIAGRDLDLTTLSAWDNRLAARAAQTEAPGSEVLCLGDSQIKFGLVPAVIEAETGRKTYNLAVLGAQPPATFFLFRQALAAGARPTAVLVDFKPSAISGDPRRNADDLPELMTLGDALDLAWSTRDPCHLARVWLPRWLPSVRSRHQVRAGVLAALRGQDAGLRREAPVHLRNRAVNRGALLIARRPEFRGRVGPEQAEVFFPRRWRAHPVHARYIRRLLALADARGITVYWLIAPIVPEAQARREALGLDATYTRFVQALQRPFRHVVVLDGRRASYPPSAFADTCHLDRQGAAVLSFDVATVLADGPGRSRWINLPAHGDRAAGMTLEDVDRSRVALSAGDRSR